MLGENDPPRDRPRPRRLDPENPRCRDHAAHHRVASRGAGRALIAESPDIDLDEDVPRAAETYLNQRKLTIFGGSNEIWRNIIAQMILQV